MSFRVHAVVAASAAAGGTGMAVSLFKTRAKSKASLLVSMKPKTAEQLGWANGDLIAVQLGEAEHHGLIRLRKDPSGTATLKLLKAGGAGKRGGPYFRLGLGVVDAFVDRSEAKRWVSFDTVEDGWLELVLPAWADETSPNKRPRSTALTITQPPMAREGVRDLAPHLMGDPPAGRSALAQKRAGGVAELSRGEARRRAEQREEPAIASAEAAEWNRKALEGDRLADLSTAFGLSRTEAKYLRELMNGRLCTKERLLAVGHEAGEELDIKSADVYVHKLRKKLATRLVDVETVRGQGYRMDARNIARVTQLIGTGDEPSREDDEAELAALNGEHDSNSGAAA